MDPRLQDKTPFQVYSGASAKSIRVSQVLLLMSMLALPIFVGSMSGQSPPGANPPYVPSSDPHSENIPILVTDMWGRRIVRFTDMGGTNWETGPTRSDESLISPWHFAMDCSARIYVADRDANRIIRMDDLAGNGWTTFSGVGSNQLQTPISVNVDAVGRIYITDSTARIIRIDDMRGTGWTTLGPTVSAASPKEIGFKVVIFDRQGRMYGSDTDQHRIARFDDMNGKGWIAFGSQGSSVGQFNRPEGLALDSLGRIYVTDNENHRIVRINDMTGAGWTSFGSFGRVDPGSQTGAVGQFSEPHDISVSDTMRIYISDTGNGRIVRIDDMDGSGWTTFGRPAKQFQPSNPACPGGNCTPPDKYEFIAAKGLRLDPADLNAPDAPTGLIASPGKTTLTLTWRAPQKAVTSYLVEFGTAAASSDITTTDTGSRDTTWTVDIRDPGTYYIRVRAKGNCGRSVASNEVMVVM